MYPLSGGAIFIIYKQHFIQAEKCFYARIYDSLDSTFFVAYGLNGDWWSQQSTYRRQSAGSISQI